MGRSSLSRDQCEVTLISPQRLMLTTRSVMNNTLVLKESGQRLIVAPGQSTELADGDQIALLASDPKEHASVIMSRDAPGSHMEAGGIDEKGLVARLRPLRAAEQTPGESSVAEHASAEMSDAAEMSGKRGAVVLILVGPPGAGKSTFAEELMRRTSGQWQRINQDTIAGANRKGTRQQCVSAARKALQSGVSCLIDRCNYDADQRKDFTALARLEGRQAHAVVLQLPAALCASRAAERVDHEGGLQGASAKSVVYRVASQIRSAGLPNAAAEGLSSVMVCTTDADVKRALNAWAAYGSTSQRPIDAYNQGLPRKHTLVDLWGKAASNSGGSKKLNIETSPPEFGETAAGRRPSKAAVPAQKEQEVAANAAEQPIISSGLHRKNAAAARPPYVCPARRGQALARTSEDEQPAGSSGPQRITEDHSDLAGSREQSKPGAQPGQHRAVTDAFSVLLSSAKASAAASAKEPAARPHGGTRPRDGAWQDVLHQVAMHPEKYRDQQPGMCVDEQCVLVLDKFPKARHHALVMPRDPDLHDLTSLTAEHVALLNHMEAVAKDWMSEKHSESGFMLGFHSIPSMSHLHLHVISKDFDSPALKHKKHWNSYTTPFFKQLDAIRAELLQRGSVSVDRETAEQHLKEDLRCHWCHAPMKNMPTLKSHIVQCKRSCSN
ncbi:probable aprataxin at C-terminar half [Coccomyxa sp. Obi]|nr:probable aprataxin at C-terminar half [Coccomyxa sp. Obi]